MIAQVHLVRRQWRACMMATDGPDATPITDLAELSDLSWLDD
jgi:hypothetical protein